MGRKSAKGKEKAKARKEENKQLKISMAEVDEVNKIEDPMAPLAAFKKFERNGLSITLECKKRPTCKDEDVEWAFQLTKQNMKTLYEKSEWGWKDTEKREEMFEDAAWYLFARAQDGHLVGFVHFRFDMDFDDKVVYCYEIQLAKEVRRKGLGKFMMQILELLAHKTGMGKVMSTVFTHNDDAQGFFIKTLRYGIDETSPEDNIYEDQEHTYQILSKIIVQRQPLGKAQDTQNTGAQAATVKT
ncbi:unnamed protein product [Owenia fusiformis]|uniref:N-alpha-acetyltransferase 40 n=1 Tax=Owenia fusiformis TaxID=6347 RepID=A0A8J1UJF5_OWEFU|nr:unnamed protein product [Owenia fusiformis]